jgi:hypothetical protein
MFVPDIDDIEEIIRLHWSILATMQFSSRPDWMELDMTMAQIKALFTISQGEAVPVAVSRNTWEWTADRQPPGR